jgi:hypothetical protein
MGAVARAAFRDSRSVTKEGASMPPISRPGRAATIKRMLEQEPELGDKLFAANAVRNAPYDRAARASFGPAGTFDPSKVFRGFSVKVDDTIEAGTKVVARWTATGTHVGAFGAVAACDNNVEFTGITIYQFQGNKIVQTWSEIDAAKIAATCGGDRTAQVTKVLAAARK